MAVLVLVLAAGCATTREGAFDVFARNASCPADRVVVREIDAPARPVPVPPPEVMADPARLEVWRSARQADAEQASAIDDRYDWYRVRGCARDTIMRCWTSDRRSVGESIFPLRHVRCDEVPSP
jgi:hypothetical protein